MARHVLILARADVGASFRNELETLHGGVHGHIAATKCRRTTDTAGTFSHHVAHGDVPDRVWDSVVDALNTATQGVRDSVDWQGKGSGVLVEDARWAVAYDGADIVAGFRITEADGVSYTAPLAVLTTLGLVATASDDTP